MASLDDFVGDNYSEDLVSKRAPDGKTVAWFHRESDVDQGEFSMHHTLGQGPYQASPGNHNHDGKNSPYLSPDAFGPGGLPGGVTPGDLVPPGVILPFAANTPPIGYLLCDGGAVSRADYARLFDLIGTTYGSGDGTTTFNVPNLKGRVPVGIDTGQTEFDSLGETGGAKTHTLTIDEMPAHTHSYDWASPASAGGVTQFNGWRMPRDGSGFVTSSPFKSAGGGQAHNNLQPYLVLNYIIKH